MFAVFNPADRAVTITGPLLPRFARTITSARPLNAFLWVDENAIRSAALPLSVATISPGPDRFIIFKTGRDVIIPPHFIPLRI